MIARVKIVADVADPEASMQYRKEIDSVIQIPTTRDDPDSIAVQGDQPLLVSVDRAAKSLGLGRSYMWSLVRSGDILTVRIGKRVLIPTRELETFVARLLEQATS